MNIERKLAAAGFTVDYARSSARLYQLKAMQQHQIIMQDREGELYYTFNDAQYCKCYYTGSKSAYWQYLTLVEEENSEKLFEPGEDAQYGRSWIFPGRGY